MGGNSFGERFRATTFGESHGGAVGVVIDGCPAGLELDVAAIQSDLARRRPGQSRLVTQRDEPDEVEIYSGLFEGRTLGTPISMVVFNADAQPGAYEEMRELYRPSHADFTTQAKYGIRNWQGGGRASARETVGRVAAGAVARQVLAQAGAGAGGATAGGASGGVEVVGWVSSVGAISSGADVESVSRESVEADPTRCADPKAAKKMTQAIEAARKDGDSLGGVVSCVARNVAPGLGEPVFDKLDADLAKAVISLPAAKGLEIGLGFDGTLMTGSEHNDEFVPPETDSAPGLASNNSGGIQGGISNGADILLRVAFKPTATIAKAQATVDTDNQAATLSARGRHDPCVLPRAVSMVEAMVCLVLADHLLRQQTTRLA